jgi:hypothetical protein
MPPASIGVTFVWICVGMKATNARNAAAKVKRFMVKLLSGGGEA